MRALLIDLDGVIYQGEVLLPGAAEALVWLGAQDVPHLFVTNTTSCSRRNIVQKLARMGVLVSEEHILSPAVAAASWLRQQASASTALFVPAATREDFAGVAQLADDVESGASSIVVGDLGAEWNFARLNRAFRLLMANPQARLIALGMTRYWRAADGLRLDAGPFVTALEFATGRPATVLGKPSPDFFQLALQLLGCPAADAVMVGDDLVSDVVAAERAGLRGVLVRTGKFREEDLQGETRPKHVISSVADVPAWWQRHSGVALSSNAKRP